jgi:hypothetical protein
VLTLSHTASDYRYHVDSKYADKSKQKWMHAEQFSPFHLQDNRLERSRLRSLMGRQNPTSVRFTELQSFATNVRGVGMYGKLLVLRLFLRR